MVNHDPSGTDPASAVAESGRGESNYGDSDSSSQNDASKGARDGEAMGHEAGAHGRMPQFSSESLFELSPDAIVVTDGLGVIRAANPRTAELFGYGPDELVGMKVEALVPARIRGRHPAHRENYSAHPRTRQMGAAMNLLALRKDGSEFPVDIMLRPADTAFGPLVLSFIRDVTEQRAATGGLRRNDQQLRSVVESVRDYAIYLLDKDGHVATWNPGAERIKGYAADEIAGRAFFAFLSQEDVERGAPAELLRLAAPRGAGGGRRLADPEGRVAVLDGQYIDGDSRLGGRADRVCKGDAGLYRSQARGRVDDAAVEPGAAGEYGCAEAAGGDFGEHWGDDSARCGDAVAVRRGEAASWWRNF